MVEKGKIEVNSSKGIEGTFGTVFEGTNSRPDFSWTFLLFPSKLKVAVKRLKEDHLYRIPGHRTCLLSEMLTIILSPFATSAMK